MSIDLQYNDDLSRVVISLFNMSEDSVRIERSTNELFWTTVRGGFQLDTSSGSASLDDFEFAADRQNFYRVLDIDDLDGGAVDSDSITPDLDGEIWWKSVRFPFLNRPARLLDRGQPIEREAGTALHDIQGRSSAIAVQDVMRSKTFEHVIETQGPDHLKDARDWDLILTTGKEFLIHIPANVRAPGGYVVLTGVSQEPLWPADNNARRAFSVNCRIIVPPAPEVVASTLVWGTVLNLYGGWNALLNDNPTWADLLDNVGSEEDLVVI